MSMGERIRERREALGMTRADLADALGVSRSAVGNYELDISAPKEEVLLRLFRVLDMEPNFLFQDSFPIPTASPEERKLMERYRSLSRAGRETAHTMLGALCAMQDALLEEEPASESRVIPLYTSPAAAGYASPVMGEDFTPIVVTAEVPAAAEFAVRIRGDSMEPHIADGSIVYVNHDRVSNGDVGIFCVDGEMLCKQYYRDKMGIVYLFSLNRRRADADVVFYKDSGRNLFCFGRVLLPLRPPLPKE
ncbi:MAG: LexA family transcriptional regulator [Oscillospiraceae bacterium]|nr:LexA family transcriptional regulator [Oscillospiraceae bacterium]